MTQAGKMQQRPKQKQPPPLLTWTAHHYTRTRSETRTITDADPKTMTLNTPIWHYCGRGKKNTDLIKSPLHNPIPAWNKAPGATLEEYAAHLWKNIKARNVPILAALDNLTPRTALYCHCKDPNTCHTSVIIDAYNYLYRSENKALRLTAEQLDAYRLASDPARLARLPSKERTAAAHIYAQGTKAYYEQKAQRRSPHGKKPRYDTDSRIEKYKPYQTGQQVFYVNGDSETPAHIAHIQYGYDFINDQATGTRRYQILNCELENRTTNQTFVYSDHHSETTKDRRRRELWPTVTAPYLEKKRPIREIIPERLAAQTELKAGHMVRFTDIVTGEVKDAGIIRKVETAAWYHLSPGAPVTIGPWTINYTSAMTGKVETWTPQEGTDANRMH